VLVVNADGTGVNVHGDGMMPSFSPRHNRIAFSRQEPNDGVWVIDGPRPGHSRFFGGGQVPS
jgi:hypothetical protein